MAKKKFRDYRKKALKFYSKSRKKHVLKVEEISLMLCDIAGIKNKNKKHIVSLGALLHDIGKSETVKAHFAKEGVEYDENDHHIYGAKYLKKCFFEHKDIKLSDKEKKF